MCGRFALFRSGDRLAAEFELAEVPTVLPRYNVAPTQPVAAVRLDAGGRKLSALRWGLIPRWAEDAKIAYKLINARCETVAEKPAFRDAFKRRRCLIPADGFFEWRKVGKEKQPYFIRRADDRPIAFAGLWERWQPPDGELVETCTIVTTTANELLASLHDRMPVILNASAFADWLAPEQSSDRLKELLRPFPAEAMTAFPVDRRVNSPRTDEPGCVVPVAGLFD